MADPPLSDKDFKYKMAWVWTTLKVFPILWIMISKEYCGYLKRIYKFWNDRVETQVQVYDREWFNDDQDLSFSFDRAVSYCYSLEPQLWL